jgi:M6 family metalloprotease-like protein
MKLLLIFLQLVSVIQALAPPHPDAEQNIHDTHRSLKGSHHHASTAPGLVNAALCDGMSEEECLDLDREFEEQARKLRRIYQTTGYLKVLVICVRFTNHAGRGLPTQEQYHGVFNSPGPDSLYAQPGSVKNYLEQNSMGTLEIDFDIMPWKTTNNTEAFYSYDNYGVTREFGVAKHAVMDQLEADGVDWADYDLDGDGYIDAMVLLHSGYQAEVGNVDCYTGAQGTQRIWSHAIANPSKRWTSPSSGIQTDNYAVGGGMRGVCRNRIPTIGIITHEFLHNFGLPDLNDNSGEYIGRGLGHYSIMSNRESYKMCMDPT